MIWCHVFYASRTFEADLSLTLDDHDDSTLLTQLKNAKSKSAENLLNICNPQGASVDEVDSSSLSVDVPTGDIPPPKPPLPSSLWNVGKFNRYKRDCLSCLQAYYMGYDIICSLSIIVEMSRAWSFWR